MADEIYVKFESYYFHYADYIVFSFLLIFSTGIGVYYGYFRRTKPSLPETGGVGFTEIPSEKKADFGSTELGEYLLGSRKLSVFPIAMSLIASYISGVTMLGTPSEIYRFGMQYIVIIISIMFMGLVVSFVYLPVFHAIKVSSSYEYLELRFNFVVRSIASFLFVLDEILFLPMILYVPALALNQVTGIDLHLVSFTLCAVCVVYTIIGGIKAVVHTDAWQTLVMFVSVVVVIILGSVLTTSKGNVFKNALDGGRLDVLNISTSMYERQTFWAVLIGGFFYWTAFNSVNQTMVQRYMAVSTVRKAQKSVAIFVLGVILFISMCSYAGLLIYNYYKNCDPLAAGLIGNYDQLFPLYVMATVGQYHGIPGLFIAGLFGAALSCLSVVLNSSALVILEDIIKGCFKLKVSERISKVIVKASIVVLGFSAIGLVFVLEKMSGILSVSASLTAIAGSTSFSIFTLGMLFPWCNSKGAIVGGITGALTTSWMSFGLNAAIASGKVVPKALDISVSECPGNITLPETEIRDESDVFFLYRLSFHWVAPIGILVTLLVGNIVSLATGPTKLASLDARLITPFLHKFLPAECFQPHSTSDLTAPVTPLREVNKK